jgi:hypothetical protein
MFVLCFTSMSPLGQCAKPVGAAAAAGSADAVGGATNTSAAVAAAAERMPIPYMVSPSFA